MSKFKNMNGERVSNLFATVTRILVIFILALKSCNSLKLEDVMEMQNNNKVCRTKQCKEAASVMRSAIDDSVDPCTNFYKFACGKYAKTAFIPEGKTARSLDFDWQIQVNSDLNDIISQPVNQNDPEALNRARTYFQMCMNTDEIETLGYQTLIEILGLINVPLIPIFPKDADIDFTSIAAKVVRYPAIDFMIKVFVSGDSSNQAINTVFIGKGTSTTNSRNFEFSNDKMDFSIFLEDDNKESDNAYFSATDEQNSNVPYCLINKNHDIKDFNDLPDSKQNPRSTNNPPDDPQTPQSPDGSADKKSEDSKAEKLSAFKKYIKKMINLLKPFATEMSDINLEDPQLDEEMNNLFQFLVKRDTIRYSSYNDLWTDKKFTIKDLQNKTFKRPDGKITFEWKKYLDLIFENVYGQSHQFDEDDEIVVYAWSYVKKVLKLYSETEPRILVMAIWLDHMISTTLITTKEMRKIYDEFRSEAFGISPGNRRSFCWDKVLTNYSYAISYKLVKDPLSTFKKFKLEHMTEVIKMIFKNAVIKADWIDPFSKKTALEKLKVMRKFVGFPSWATDVNVLNSIYTQEELKNFVVATIRIEVMSKLRNLYSLFSHNDENSKGFQMMPHVVNAAYAHTDNSLTLPWGIMHIPYYGYGLDALDFGALGRVVGHEVTHGYDNNGRKFNHDGNNSVWMTKTSTKSFREGAKCFIKSYSSIRMEEIGKNVDGELSLNENIADNGGIALAYTAFQILKKRSPFNTLIGFEKYNQEQLFTIGVALPFCGNFSKEHLLQELTDVHPPSEARVNGMMMNFSEFPKIWKCKSTALMNPSEKCKIW